MLLWLRSSNVFWSGPPSGYVSETLFCFNTPAVKDKLSFCMRTCSAGNVFITVWAQVCEEIVIIFFQSLLLLSHLTRCSVSKNYLLNKTLAQMQQNVTFWKEKRTRNSIIQLVNIEEDWRVRTCVAARCEHMRLWRSRLCFIRICLPIVKCLCYGQPSSKHLTRLQCTRTGMHKAS